MRFRHHHHSSSLPKLDMTPMLNVMMGILAFFVMVTMLMAEEQQVNVQLPQVTRAATAPENAAQLQVQLNSQQQVTVNGLLVERSQLTSQMRDFFTANPEGTVVLQADLQVPYQEVVVLLEEMQAVGGDRVSLAVE
ncbi:MAG TPA: biopolymer transporter ExbD [Synechococcales cyanobacterium M55_K2018_004]|nr:biopolymer transporter ExbD [Synechococcales cyanobacterium M55_K2018_004]